MITACGFPGDPPHPQATVFIGTTPKTDQELNFSAYRALCDNIFQFSSSFPKRHQQFFVNPAKPAIAHNHQPVACTSLLRD